MNANTIQSKLGFIIRKNLIQLLVVTILIVVAFFLLRLLNKPIAHSFSEQWDLWLEAFLSFALIIIAVAIWINEQNEVWVRSLPKKLNINYILNNETLYTVLNAPLSGESDIRAWSQSIAQTCIQKDRLPIKYIGFNTSAGIIDRKRRMVIYHHNVFLYEEIENVEKGSIFEYSDDGSLFSIRPSLVNQK